MIAPRLSGRVILVPEAWTQLIDEGHPLPDASWSGEDWLRRQRLVASRQLELERAGEKAARAANVTGLVIDRGLMDDTVYPMGTQAVTELFGGPAEAAQRYQMVLHLESLSTADPERFLSLMRSNSARYESLAAAREVEARTREAWRFHPNWHFLGGSRAIGAVADEAYRLISSALG